MQIGTNFQNNSFIVFNSVFFHVWYLVLLGKWIIDYRLYPWYLYYILHFISVLLFFFNCQYLNRNTHWIINAVSIVKCSGSHLYIRDLHQIVLYIHRYFNYPWSLRQAIHLLKEEMNKKYPREHWRKNAGIFVNKKKINPVPRRKPLEFRVLLKFSFQRGVFKSS